MLRALVQDVAPEPPSGLEPLELDEHAPMPKAPAPRAALIPMPTKKCERMIEPSAMKERGEDSIRNTPGIEPVAAGPFRSATLLEFYNDTSGCRWRSGRRENCSGPRCEGKAEFMRDRYETRRRRASRATWSALRHSW